MLKNFIIILLLFCLSQKLTVQKFYGITKADKNLWVDKTEITVNEYRQFLNDLV